MGQQFKVNHRRPKLKRLFDGPFGKISSAKSHYQDGRSSFSLSACNVSCSFGVRDSDNLPVTLNGSSSLFLSVVPFLGLLVSRRKGISIIESRRVRASIPLSRNYQPRLTSDVFQLSFVPFFLFGFFTFHFYFLFYPPFFYQFTIVDGVLFFSRNVCR